MKKNTISAVVGVCALLLLSSLHSFGQGISGTYEALRVTGTATINTLEVSGTANLLGGLSLTGPADFKEGSLLFGTVASGTSSGEAGVAAIYVDGTTSRLHLSATRPSHEWLWERNTVSPVPMMKLDASHVLTIYDTAGNPAIVLNPANLSGPTSLLTQQAADSRYVSSENFTVTTVGGGPAIALTGGTATHPWSFAGFNAIASGTLSVASGAYSTASSTKATASGYRSTASGAYSTAIGPMSTTTQDFSMAVGVSSTASGWYSMASGHLSIASGYQSMACALSSTASGTISMASGNFSTASGQQSTASGLGSIASGTQSVASGAYSRASGNYSVASGWSSVASGHGSMASGMGSVASGKYATASGHVTTAVGYAQYVIGQYNIIPQSDPLTWVPSDELFTIGNGLNASAASNALVVKKNGDTTVYGKLTLSGSNGSTAATPYGASIAYDDGIGGVNSSITLQSTRPSSVWNWKRATASGTSANAMQLDASNRLILTGTAATNPPQLVLDPNETGPTSVLTQQAADSRYVSSASLTVGSVPDWEGIMRPAVALTGGTATGAGSFAGINATASGHGSTAIGRYSTASGELSMALGWHSTASGEYSTAIGGYSTASGELSTAMGFSSTASGGDSMAVGNGSIVSGYESMAMGYHSTASGDWGSAASGYYAVASGCYATASGVFSHASGEGSVASGLRSTASGVNSVAAGAFTNAAGCGQFVVGRANILQGDPYNWVSTDDLFIIGNGVPSVDFWGDPIYDENGILVSGISSNAFVVKKNGDTTIYGKLTVSGPNSSGLVVTGTSVPVTLTSGTAATKIVASGSNQLVLIPEQGDLSMGDFINGARPQ